MKQFKEYFVEGYKCIPFYGLDYDQWLAIRNSMGLALGGSDISVVCGVNEYATPSLLFDQKLGLTPPVDLSANKSVYWGNSLEDIVIDKSQYYDTAVQDSYLFNKDKIRVHKHFPYTIQHESMPFLFANVDALGYDPDNPESLEDPIDIIERLGRMVRPDYIIEAKTMNKHVYDKWGNDSTRGLPIGYIYQNLGYLIQMLPLQKEMHGIIFSLVSGLDFYAYEIRYEQNMIDDILEKCYKFHLTLLEGEQVILNSTSDYQKARGLSEVRPEPDNTDNLSKHLNEHYLKKLDVGSKMMGDSSHTELAKSYKELASKESDMKKQKTLISNKIKDELRNQSVTQIDLPDDGGYMRWSNRLIIKTNG